MAGLAKATRVPSSEIEARSQFEFARVDLYNTPAGLVLGEITLAPGGARLRLRSPELDMWMGDQWDSGFFKPGWRPRTSSFPF